MLIVPLSRWRPCPRLVNQREPAIIKGDRLRAAAELFGCDRRLRLDDGAGLIVHDACRIAQIDELQSDPRHSRHPVLLVQPGSRWMEQSPLREARLARQAIVHTGQYLFS